MRDFWILIDWIGLGRDVVQLGRCMRVEGWDGMGWDVSCLFFDMRVFWTRIYSRMIDAGMM